MTDSDIESANYDNSESDRSPMGEFEITLAPVRENIVNLRWTEEKSKWNIFRFFTNSSTEVGGVFEIMYKQGDSFCARIASYCGEKPGEIGVIPKNAVWSCDISVRIFNFDMGEIL